MGVLAFRALRKHLPAPPPGSDVSLPLIGGSHRSYGGTGIAGSDVELVRRDDDEYGWMYGARTTTARAAPNYYA